MTNTVQPKMFTLERQQKKAGGSVLQVGRMAAPTNVAASASQTAVDNSEVLDALAELRKDLLEAGVIGQRPADLVESEIAKAEIDEAAEQARQEVSLLRAEISALAHMIRQTKLEISAVRSSDPEQDKILAMTLELDAVVGATENATNTILEVAEVVDDLAVKIQTESQDDDSRHQAESITENMMRIYEACNFQDLTGQRITKVVNTLMYVEERLNKMIEIWGEEDTLHAEPTQVSKQPEDVHEEAHLLNGPQLENQGISQADIDALFD